MRLRSTWVAALPRSTPGPHHGVRRLRLRAQRNPVGLAGPSDQLCVSCQPARISGQRCLSRGSALSYSDAADLPVLRLPSKLSRGVALLALCGGPYREMLLSPTHEFLRAPAWQTFLRSGGGGTAGTGRCCVVLRPARRARVCRLRSGLPATCGRARQSQALPPAALPVRTAWPGLLASGAPAFWPPRSAWAHAPRRRYAHSETIVAHDDHYSIVT